MRPEAASHALAALLELLGAASALRSKSPATALVQRACATVEFELADEGLSADRLAERMRISRRYLDALFIQQGGSTVSAYIRERFGIAPSIYRRG